MPNHYDIDCYCEKCGKYLGTLYPDDPVPAGRDICSLCREKEMKKKRKPKFH